MRTPQQDSRNPSNQDTPISSDLEVLCTQWEKPLHCCLGGLSWRHLIIVGHITRLRVRVTGRLEVGRVENSVSSYLCIAKQSCTSREGEGEGEGGEGEGEREMAVDCS